MALLGFCIVCVTLVSVAGAQDSKTTPGNETSPAFQTAEEEEKDEADKVARGKIKNVSYLLDLILQGYNRYERPHMHMNIPTPVNIDIFVRTMGPISEKDNSLVFDCYFRQMWNDPRLTFRGGAGSTKVLSLQRSMLERIWKPDTYFWNGKGSHLHRLTVPNQLVRLNENGTILYSSRLTIRSICPMELSRFPMDVQTCPLTIGSFGYRSHEMVFHWGRGNASVIPDTWTLKEQSQFTLRSIRLDKFNAQKGGFDYSVLSVEFGLERHMGYFLINFYVPCTLIVFLSWVALWINREATSDRIALGITSILTMTFISVDSRSDIPKVAHSTALDVYILICFVYLLICILEFTIVHHFTKFNTGDPELHYIERERIKEEVQRLSKGLKRQITCRRNRASCAVERVVNKSRSQMDIRRESPEKRMMQVLLDGTDGACAQTRHISMSKSTDRPLMTIERTASPGIERSVTGGRSPERKDSLADQMLSTLGRLGNSLRRSSRSPRPQNSFFVDNEEFMVNSVSRIDTVARVVFPLSFFVTITVYWSFYLGDTVRI